VAAPMENAQAVEALMKKVMNEEVRQHSGLLTRDVSLPVKIRRGKTWADIL
jgi:hypothetical protein